MALSSLPDKRCLRIRADLPMGFCSTCGHEYSNIYVVCPRCDTTLEERQSPTRRLRRIITLLILLACVVGLIFFVISGLATEILRPRPILPPPPPEGFRPIGSISGLSPAVLSILLLPTILFLIYYLVKRLFGSRRARRSRD